MKKIIPFCLIVLVALLGCSAGRTPTHLASTQPTTSQPAQPECQSADEMDFLDCMVRKTKCTVADAARAVCILANDGDVGKTFDERYQYLLDHKMLRPNWELTPDQWIDRGTLAYMFLKAAKMKGGVNMNVFGSLGLGDRRYAYREMLYYELMETGVDYCYVSGPELVTAIGKVNRFIQEHEEDSPADATNLGNNSQNVAP